MSASVSIFAQIGILIVTICKQILYRIVMYVNGMCNLFVNMDFVHVSIGISHLVHIMGIFPLNTNTYI